MTEPVTDRQIEDWKRMSWGHYNAPVARMLNELSRLRSSPVAAADGALREAAERVNRAEWNTRELMDALIALRTALSRVPPSVAASGGEP
jgi:hypothetical protein